MKTGFQQTFSIGHCISAVAKMSKEFTDFFHRISGLRPICEKAKLFKVKVYHFWFSTGRRYIYNLITKEGFADKPDMPTLLSICESKSHAVYA